MESQAALSVAARFAVIIGGLRVAVAGRIGYFAVTGPMILYICNRLNTINHRFQALAALIRSGKLPAGRVRAPRETAGPAIVPPPDPGPAAARDPFPVWRLVPTHRFAWLCIVAPNWAGPHYASAWGGALRELLADPDMAVLLAATPRMGKLLRPLCWALGIEVSILRPRVAPADVAEAATRFADPDGVRAVSRGGMAGTWMTPNEIRPAEPSVAGGWTPGFFVPA